MPRTTKSKKKASDRTEVQVGEELQAAALELGKLNLGSSLHTPLSYRQTSTASTPSSTSSSISSSTFSTRREIEETPPTPLTAGNDYFDRILKNDNKDPDIPAEGSKSGTPSSVDTLRAMIQDSRWLESPMKDKAARQEKEEARKKGKAAINGTSSQDKIDIIAASRQHGRAIDLPRDAGTEPSVDLSLERNDSDTEMIDVDQLPFFQESDSDNSQGTKDIPKNAPAAADDHVSVSEDSDEDDPVTSATGKKFTSPTNRRPSQSDPAGSPREEQPGSPAIRPPQKQSKSRARSNSDPTPTAIEQDDDTPVAQPSPPAKPKAPKGLQPSKRGNRQSLQANGPQNTTRKVSAPARLTAPRQARVVGTAPQTEKLQPHGPQPDAEEADEEQSVLMTGALDASITGTGAGRSPSPVIVGLTEKAPGERTILHRAEDKIKSKNQLKQLVLDVLSRKVGKAKTRPEDLRTALLHHLYSLRWVQDLRPLLDNFYIPTWVQKLFAINMKAYNPTEGYIYLFKSEEYEGYIKIGMTRLTRDDRQRQWEKQCNFKAIYIEDPNDHRFWNCEIVERIVHAELYNERVLFKCKHCRQNAAHRFNPELGNRSTFHGEWFNVSEAHALGVIQKWRKWATDAEPYAISGTLGYFWQDRYEAFSRDASADMDDWFTIDLKAMALFVGRCLMKIMKFVVVPALCLAMLTPTVIWMPPYILVRYGIGLFGWGVLLLTSLCLGLLITKFH